MLRKFKSDTCIEVKRTRNYPFKVTETKPWTLKLKPSFGRALLNSDNSTAISTA
jgi:hypothetical protein